MIIMIINIYVLEKNIRNIKILNVITNNIILIVIDVIAVTIIIFTAMNFVIGSLTVIMTIRFAIIDIISGAANIIAIIIIIIIILLIFWDVIAISFNHYYFYNYPYFYCPYHYWYYSYYSFIIIILTDWYSYYLYYNYQNYLYDYLFQGCLFCRRSLSRGRCTGRSKHAGQSANLYCWLIRFLILISRLFRLKQMTRSMQWSVW